MSQNLATNKSLKRTKNSWLFAPSSLILANYFLPLSEALGCMKRFSISLFIWLTIFFLLGEATRFTYIYLDDLYPYGSSDFFPIRLWLSFSIEAIIYLLIGITLKLIYKSTAISVILGLVIGVSDLLLDIYFGSPIVTYETAHPDNLDLFFTYGPVLSPFIFIPIGVLFLVLLRSKSKRIGGLTP